MKYFWSVVFLALNLHLQLSVAKNPTYLLNKTKRNVPVLVRDKRFEHLSTLPSFSCFIDLRIESGITTTEKTIGRLVRSKILALTNTIADGDDVTFNLQIIEKYINKNFGENNPIKLAIKKDYPELEEVIHFSKHGFQCDQQFCDKNGIGAYGFGICSPYSCFCRMSGPEAKKCKWNLKFDPVYRNCDVPTNIKICGM